MEIEALVRGYPGRGVVVHVDPAGKLGWIYFVTGRSEASRQRVAHRLDATTLAIVPSAEGATSDPLRHYICAQAVGGPEEGIVVGNGDHVPILAQGISQNRQLATVVEGLIPEPDPPLHTPRIAAVLDDSPHMVAVYGTQQAVVDRRIQALDRTPGATTIVTTYTGTAERPVSSAPQTVVSDHRSLHDLAAAIWRALPQDLRVLLLAGEVHTSGRDLPPVTLYRRDCEDPMQL